LADRAAPPRETQRETPVAAVDASVTQIPSRDYLPDTGKQARSVGERACYDERGWAGQLCSPMDEEWDHSLDKPRVTKE